MVCIYIYQWIWTERYVVEIRGYGILNGEVVCLTVDDFLPHVYVSDVEGVDLSQCVKHALVERENLYNFKPGKHLFHKLFFRTKAATYRFIRDFHLEGRAHEQNASPLLQFLTQQRLPQVGWVEIDDGTARRSGQAYSVDWSRVEAGDGPLLDPPACAFDLEVYSTVPGAMPSNKPGDEIFQISVVFSDGDEYLLSLRAVDYDESVLQYSSERDLILGFIRLLRSKKPVVLYGYNILGFDISYLIQRCVRLLILDELLGLGYGEAGAEIKTVRWASDAFGDQEFTYVDWEGVVILDLYPIVKRDYKFSNYKLETVAQELLGCGKDPVTPRDITEAYTSRRMRRVGDYCLKDSRLCLDLARKISVWIGLVQMANVCCVQPMTLYLHGQQIKIYSQVYNYCHWNDIVVNTNAYRVPSSMKYTGAYVMEPVLGLYEHVVPFDFSSLYPSIIITENICYSTIADKRVPAEKCNVFAWEDHVGCEHDPKIVASGAISAEINALEREIADLRRRRDAARGDGKKAWQTRINEKRLLQKPLRRSRVDLKAQKKTVICAKHTFRFLKPSEKKGVIPTIIQNLLDARKEIKLKLKKETDPVLRTILDKQQLAYKVSANSMYGAMGVRSGYLPYMPGAMTITHCGRSAIKKSLRIIESEFGGRVIYGDTDSNYVQFPDMPIDRLWDYSLEVAKKVSAHFPKTMSLEFEEKIYKQFILLGKKKYVYVSWADGVEKIGHKGVILSRRDNPQVVRRVYSDCLREIFTTKSQSRVVDILTDRLSRIGSMYHIDDFVLTKSVGTYEGEYDADTGRIGNYKVTKFKPGVPDDEWTETGLPAHVQLAKRMSARGVPVQPGTRLEIVVLDRPGRTKLGDKFEELDYFKARCWHLKLDLDYYTRSMINPIDQLTQVVFGAPMLESIVPTLRNKRRIMEQIQKRRKPKLIFRD